MPRIPDIPGQLVQRGSEQELWLKRRVATLCHLDYDRFPGSQPISFASGHLTRLEKQDFWVCEKSDGIRVLFFLQTDLPSSTQMVYLIDRHNTYREIGGFWFPHHERRDQPLRDTIVDGELVIDVDPATNEETLRYLAFDCLVVDSQHVMSRPLDKRYGRLRDWFYRPYAAMLHSQVNMLPPQPFSIKVKDINFSYTIDHVFQAIIPSLQHGNDGLIYTCVETPYTPGTDENIFKWKPPSENSIDFKLVLRFPPLKGSPSQPDFQAKPFFGLHVYCGDERGQARYEPYDELYVTDAEWEQMKLSGDQYDDRVVEVHWDSASSHWRMMRFRDDKPNGNYKTVVEKIIQSIVDGVEKDSLLGRCPVIRTAWKERMNRGSQAQQPLPTPTGPPSSAGGSYPAHGSSNGPLPTRLPPGDCTFRYGAIATSPWSKVSGPITFAGMRR